MILRVAGRQRRVLHVGDDVGLVRAEQLQREVDEVRARVEERAAAELAQRLPVPPPREAVHRQPDLHDAAEFPRLGHLAHFGEVRPVPHVVEHRQHAIGFPRGVDHSIGVRGRQRKRLLAYDMLPLSQRLQHLGGVDVARRRDDDQVHVRVREQRGRVGVCPTPQPLNCFPASFVLRVRYRHDPE